MTKMDYQEIKLIMRGKARLAKGLVNLLKDDTEHIYNDVNEFDMIRFEEDLREAKRTTQQLADVITDLEHYSFLIKRDA